MARWKRASGMPLLMFSEFYYLLSWATLGWWLNRDTLPRVFDVIALIAARDRSFAVFSAYFGGALLSKVQLRDRQIFHAFRAARLSQYVGIMAIAL